MSVVLLAKMSGAEESTPSLDWIQLAHFSANADPMVVWILEMQITSKQCTPMDQPLCLLVLVSEDPLPMQISLQMVEQASRVASPTRAPIHVLWNITVSMCIRFHNSQLEQYFVI